MYGNPGPAEARIAGLLAEAERQLDRGAQAEAIAAQREAAAEARQLAARFPDDLRLRQGLASVLYNLASLLASAGDPAAAVPELDACLDLYESPAGAVADSGLRCADVRARRGLAQAATGRAASAIVDAGAAVLAYLEATSGDIDHPLGRDVARVACMNAVVLARHGDPDLAVASADGALAWYVGAAERSPGGRLPAEDGGFLRSAAAVSAMFHLGLGELAEGFYAALIIVSNLAPGAVTPSLERELTDIERLLARSEEVHRPVPYPVDHGRALAGELIPLLRDTAVLWLPSGQPDGGQPGDGPGWPGWDPSPALAEALGRHATGPDAAELVADLTGGQPRELVWTPSMRWPGRQVASGLRLAGLAIETLPRRYADGLRLALDAHALLAAGHQRRRPNAAAAPAGNVLAWRRLLAETATACRTAGDDALAEDLAGWAAAISESNL